MDVDVADASAFEVTGRDEPYHVIIPGHGGFWEELHVSQRRRRRREHSEQQLAQHKRMEVCLVAFEERPERPATPSEVFNPHLMCQ